MLNVSLQECLSTGIRITFASDGGAVPRYGAFGCVIASDKEILWEGGTQAAGEDPRSFRAEGYGMFGNVIFLHHFQLHSVPQHRARLDLQNTLW
jgi:hypothetical protein